MQRPGRRAGCCSGVSAAPVGSSANRHSPSRQPCRHHPDPDVSSPHLRPCPAAHAPWSPTETRRDRGRDLGDSVDRWAAGTGRDAWMFSAPRGGPLSEGTGSVRGMVGREDGDRVPGLRVHDLRSTAAAVWLGAGADPNVVQRVLRHASAAMTMDLYRHPIDQNVWHAAKRLGAPRRHRMSWRPEVRKPRARKVAPDPSVCVEPPVGIEPATFSLRVGSSVPHMASTSTNTNTGGRTTPHDPHRLPPSRTTNSTTRCRRGRPASMTTLDSSARPPAPCDSSPCWTAGVAWGTRSSSNRCRANGLSCR